MSSIPPSEPDHDPIDATRTEPDGSSYDERLTSPGNVLPRRLGAYLLLKELGAGGMGVVYEAQQDNPRRRVALKTIRFTLASDPKARERFKNEIDAVVALNHPNILPLYDAKETTGVPYFTMQLVSGKTLSDWLEETAGKSDFRFSIQLLTQVCDAIAHAHEMKIVHRDLKPSNVLIEANGRPYVADFGLARFFDSESDLTQANAELGTRAYLAPEQTRAVRQETKARGLPTATDIYGLGGILYFLLTRQAPFPDGDVEKIRYHPPVTPSTIDPKVDRDLDTICLCCLEKAPGDRYSNPHELRADLQRWLDGRPIVARPANFVERLHKWRRRKPAVAALTLMLLFTILTAMVIALFQRREQRKTLIQLADAQFQIAARRSQQRTKLELDSVGSRPLPEVLADWAFRYQSEPTNQHAKLWTQKIINHGRFPILSEPAKDLRGPLKHVSMINPSAVAYVRGESKSAPLVQSGKTSIELPMATNLISLAASSDGHRIILSTADSKVMIYSLTNLGEPLVFHTEQPLRSCRLSRTSELLAGITSSESIQLWNLGQQPPTRIDLVGDSRSGSSPVISAHFSPGGDSLIAVDGQNAVATIYDARTGLKKADLDVRRTQRKKAWLRFAAWTTDGRIVTATDNGTMNFWDSRDGAAIGNAFGGGSTIAGLLVSPNGHLIATHSGRTVHLWSAKTGELHRHVPHNATVDRIQFSPSGKLLSVLTANGRLHVWNAASGRTAAEPIPHEAPVLAFRVDEQHQSITTVARNGLLRRWSYACRQPSIRHDDDIRTLAFHPQYESNSIFLTASFDRTASEWNASSWTRHSRLNATAEILSAAYGPAGDTLMIGQAGSPAALYQRDGAAWELFHLLKLNRHVYDIDYDTNSRRFVTGSVNKNAVQWSHRGRKQLPTMKHGHFVVSVDYSPDGKLIATASLDNFVRIWSSQSSPHEATRPPLHKWSHGAKVKWTEFHPREPILASAGEDNAAHLWSAKTGHELTAPLRHQDHVNCVRFSPTGEFVITASDDNTAQLWETATGKPHGPPLRHDDKVQYAAFDQRGERVATASWDHSVKVWEVNSGRPILARLRHDAVVYVAEFSPSGAHLFTADNSGVLKRWSFKQKQDLDHGSKLSHLAEQLCGLRKHPGRGYLSVPRLLPVAINWPGEGADSNLADGR